MTLTMNSRASRTFLFVPGSRPDRFNKALASGADTVIIDLEDALADNEKTAARDAAATYLLDQTALVRINGFNTPWFEDDVIGLADTPGLIGVVLPKAESADAIDMLSSRLGAGVQIFPLIETARGLTNAGRIAEQHGVSRLMFGNLDFAFDVGANVHEPQCQELLFARSSIVVASRSAGLLGPIDGVQPKVDDDGATFESARRAADLGFSGMLCLHPRQIAIVDEAFAPSEEMVNWANEITRLARNANEGVLRIDGEMIDAPQLARARRILEHYASDERRILTRDGRTFEMEGPRVH
jgi:citrate lyase subunit beta / citryl-CoA lyase